MERMITIPDAVDDGAILEAAGEYRRLWTDHRAESARLDELTNERGQAHRDDIEAEAVALRAGKPKPKASKVAKVDEAMIDVRRRIEVLEAAIAQSRLDLIATIEDRTPGYRAELEQRAAAARDALAAAVETVAAAHAELDEALSLALWLDAGPSPKPAPRSAETTAVRSLPSPSGQSFSWVAVLDALRSAAAPPEGAEPMYLRYDPEKASAQLRRQMGEEPGVMIGDGSGGFRMVNPTDGRPRGGGAPATVGGALVFDRNALPDDDD